MEPLALACGASLTARVAARPACSTPLQHAGPCSVSTSPKWPAWKPHRLTRSAIYVASLSLMGTRHLIRAAERAARDEIRHARMTRALAHRYGSVALSPNVEPRPVRDLIGMAIENAVEGCVREAFGALVACWQGRAAVDPVIRAAMARIARDETRHAALAFQVNGWLKGKLDGPARARVAEARRQALDDSFGRSSEAPLALRAALGLPTQHQCRALAGHLARLAA